MVPSLPVIKMMVKKSVMALAAAACLLLSACDPVKDINAIVIEDIDFAQVRDGVYTARQNNFPVTAKVEATVELGRVTGVRVLRHFHGPDRGAEAITGRIVEQQSLKVDAVSGATLSSTVILKAVESALKKGL